MSEHARAATVAPTPAPRSCPSLGNPLQRKCACGPGPSGECTSCAKKRTLQRASLPSSIGKGGPGERVPTIVRDVLRSPGQPLDGSGRAHLESSFGRHFSDLSIGPVQMQSALAVGPADTSLEREAESISRQVMAEPPSAAPGGRVDFSQVRIHADAEAHRAARAVDARAFTVGHHVVFAAGEYAPQTNDGRNLLAHELTHVVQQAAGRDAASLVQRATTRGAGGCAPPTEIDEDDDGARAAGRTAHRQIQAFLLPTIRSEVEIPRGTKRQIGSVGCQPDTTNAGFADLLRMSGLVVDLGEIKSFPWSATYGVADVEHYIRRSRQSIDRQFGLGVECPGMPASADDARFARAVHAGRMVPRAFGKLTDVLTGDTVIGPFDGDRARTLKAKLQAPGAVGYWCTGGASDTYTCGVSQEETRAYVDRMLSPAQEVLSRVMEETIERPLARMLERLSVRQLLELGERHMGPQIREALQHLGPLAAPLITRANAQELGDFIDQHLGPVAASIATTLARRFASRVVNELRIRLRNALADIVRDTLARLCVGVPVVTLVQLLNELEKELKRQARQLIPVVATAVALAMVAEVVEMIMQAVSDFANAVLRILAVIALVVLAAAIIVVGIIFLITLIDPLPGDEVAVGAAEAFLIQLLRSVAGFAFAAAESGAVPGEVLVERETGEPGSTGGTGGVAV